MNPVTRCIVYGRDADAALVARTADRALEGSGCFVMVENGEVWIWRRDKPVNGATQFLPGQQLIVAPDGSWEIKPAPKLAPNPAKRTPEQWCAEYGVHILDPDGWRSKDAPAWTEPITLADFYDRAVQCTIRNVAAVDWKRIAGDVKAAAA